MCRVPIAVTIAATAVVQYNNKNNRTHTLYCILCRDSRRISLLVSTERRVTAYRGRFRKPGTVVEKQNHLTDITT